MLVHGSQGAWGLLHLGWMLCGKQAQPYPFHSTAELHGLNLCLELRWLPPVKSTLLRLEEKSLNRNTRLEIITSHDWMCSFLCLVYSCVLNSWEEKNVSYSGRKPILGSTPAPSGGHLNHQHILFRKFRCLTWMRKFSLPFCRLQVGELLHVHLSMFSVRTLGLFWIQ